MNKCVLKRDRCRQYNAALNKVGGTLAVLGLRQRFKHDVGEHGAYTQNTDTLNIRVKQRVGNSLAHSISMPLVRACATTSRKKCIK